MPRNTREGPREREPETGLLANPSQLPSHARARELAALADPSNPRERERVCYLLSRDNLWRTGETAVVLAEAWGLKDSEGLPNHGRIEKDHSVVRAAMFLMQDVDAFRADVHAGYERAWTYAESEVERVNRLLEGANFDRPNDIKASAEAAKAAISTLKDLLQLRAQIGGMVQTGTKTAVQVNIDQSVNVADETADNFEEATFGLIAGYYPSYEDQIAALDAMREMAERARNQ